MDATQAKQIADSLNKDNTSELAEILDAISIFAYQGFYFYDCPAPLSSKTCIDLHARGFTVETSDEQMRILWDVPLNL
jgi:hypothetical protein